MTLRELLANGLVKDTDVIVMAKPLSGNACDMRKGNWFNDQVLEYMDAEVGAFSWNEDNEWSITLK